MAEIEKVKLLFEEAKKTNEPAKELFDYFIIVSRSLPRKERTELADEIYNWANDIKIQQPWNLSSALFLVATVAFQNEQYDISISKGLEARAQFKEARDEDGAAMTSMGLGTIFRTLGDVELAMQYLLETINQLKKSGAYPHILGLGCYNLGEIYIETKHYDEALALNQLAIDNESQNVNKGLTSLAYNSIANIYQHQKKYDLALSYYNKAMEDAKADHSKPNIARCLSDQGNYYFEIGDNAKAIDFHTEAMNIRKELNLAGGAVTNMIRIAEIYVKERKNDEAIQILGNALKIAEEIKVKPKIFQIHHLLSDIYNIKGEYKKSLEHNNIYHQIKDEVTHEDADKKVKNQQLIFEGEQTRKENVIIKAQKAEIENKNIQLQKTIDELTRTKISKRAKAITLIVAMALIVIEDTIMHFVINPFIHDNFLMLLSANGIIVLMLKPIENGIEHFLLNRLVK